MSSKIETIDQRGAIREHLRGLRTFRASPSKIKSEKLTEIKQSTAKLL